MPSHSLSIGFDIVLPIAVAVLFVLNLWFMLLGTIIWLGLIYMRSNSRRDRHRTPLPMVGSLVSVCLFSSIVYAAAAYGPTKIKQQHLSHELTFPTQEMELAELAYLTSRLNPDRQFLIQFSFPAADSQQVVHLPHETLTVRRLLEAIERDTGLEGRFHSCGNGYSVLFGEDCCFGLIVDGGYFTDEPFELYVYADERSKGSEAVDRTHPC